MLAFLCWSYRRSIQDAVSLEVQNNQLGRYFSPGILNQIKNVETLYLMWFLRVDLFLATSFGYYLLELNYPVLFFSLKGATT